MKYKYLITILICLLATTCWAESLLYINQTKQINGSFKYELPKLELNVAKYVGKFFGNKCYYLSEFEGSLNYTAPRSSMFSINHHSIQGEWNLGVEVSPFWATYSIGGIYYLAGNDDGIAEGGELLNSLKVGISWN